MGVLKTTVIHHSADYDGIFCREIARKFLPDAELVGWDFSDNPLPVPEGKIYILDLPVDRVFGFVPWKTEGDAGNWPGFDRIVWIDHHKSSIETHPESISGYRIDGVAACRLAWQYFTLFHPTAGSFALPKKEDYIERRVCEPIAVRLAGEYDIWDKRDERVDVFQFGLRSRELKDFDWSQMLSANGKLSIDELEGLISVGHTNLLETDGTNAPAIVHGLLMNGKLIQEYQQSSDAGMMHRSFIVEWEGLKFLALTTARCNSLTFAAKDVPETGHDALMAFYYNGKDWNFSLYHANHRKDLDLSQIAVKYGGGGHRGACGFRIERIPFLP